MKTTIFETLRDRWNQSYFPTIRETVSGYVSSERCLDEAIAQVIRDEIEEELTQPCAIDGIVINFIKHRNELENFYNPSLLELHELVRFHKSLEEYSSTDFLYCLAVFILDKHFIGKTVREAFKDKQPN